MNVIIKEQDQQAFYSKADNERYVAYNQYTKNKRLACHCAECHKRLGSFTVDAVVNFRVGSNTISTKVLEESIMPRIPDFYTTTAYCKNCGKVTTHYFVDYNLSKPIRMLNELGLTTCFCCEGHRLNWSGMDIPYIAFEDDVIKYFDPSNPLLKYFECALYENTGWGFKTMLNVALDAPLNYIATNQFIKDLTKYIHEELVGKVKIEK